MNVHSEAAAPAYAPLLQFLDHAPPPPAPFQLITPGGADDEEVPDAKTQAADWARKAQRQLLASLAGHLIGLRSFSMLSMLR